ncbi:Ada metal-binding domain-containing protein [uncultured Desulfosarcina sp.]|uniref:Ada metal-binding domain-containing protein n=1 Tax=uncultured Desulfosarcina sp. TaxID=218289 RepID=UPI0029C6D72F|nr:Ada metal-binding domain-containing protein [uncultured Desulfosarcina sp.]
MQIKRFEAADMTEALRLVKRAFGDDAVILSAKEAKPRGFFGAWKKKHVEITAATDYPLSRDDDEKAFTGLLARQLDEINAADRVSLSSVPQSGALADGRRFAALKKEAKEGTLRKERENSASFRPGPIFAQKVPMEGVWQQGPGGYLRATVPDKRNEAFLPETDSTPLSAEPFTDRREKKQVIALVGPPGAGKSSALAKLAWQCRVLEQRKVGMISLDRYRMAANGLLNRFARIANLRLFIIHDIDDLQLALNELADADVILIDTPGIGHGDRSMLETVGFLLHAAAPDETHLVLNATVKDAVLAAAVENFRPVHPNRLLLTHLDECDGDPVSVDLLNQIRLPASFLADGVDLYEKLEAATAGRLKDIAANRTAAGGRVTVFPSRKSRLNDQTVDDSTASARFLANRNSELFHDPACKSVKRINVENIIAFDSIEQAISEGFKPCRACCNIDEIRKMGTGSAGFQRARAM